MRHWTPDVQLIWSEGVAHMLGTNLPVLVPSLSLSANNSRMLDMQFLWAQLGPTRSCAVVHFFEVSFTAIYIDAGIHTDVEVHSDICLTGSLTAVLGTRPRAEPSGTRFDGSVHDGDQRIEKMPTSKKVTHKDHCSEEKIYVSSTVDPTTVTFL